MSIELAQLVPGDTNYIGKHNSNYAIIKGAVDALQGATQGGASSAATAVTAFEGMFGSVALIGYGSFAASTSGTNLTLQPGYTWRNSLSKVLQLVAAATLDFTGKSAATYYIEVDAGGQPNVVETSAEPIFSVVWTGSAFGAITRVAPTFPSATDFLAALTSAALGTTYGSLDERFEAGEAKAVLGELARAFQTGRLSMSVAGGADVTLTATEANNLVLNFTGALIENINVIVPIGTNPRAWIVTNNTSGAYTLTVKGATGTGVAVAQGGVAHLYQDGTNVKAAANIGATAFTGLGDVPSSYTGKALKSVRVKSDETGLEFYDPPYDVGGTYNGAPAASAVLVRLPFPRQVIFPAGLTNSRGTAGTAATAQTDFDIQKNGASVGTMRFAASAMTPTFIMASQTTFAAGDILRVVAPATPDATLADIGFSLAGTR
ncbi:hypothetical protein CF68_32975 [Cupriavidus sp. SK-4]|uniref:hypothetical protein n=1 Tax=Cupriavidus sp. SK-4 TaxID=574750 RepID=UPI00045084F7|nr:hypothetical protein [Cupriavidus sp. SK-4]EYS89466.1 hypothetical protein CF68_32975 [Cupriavidus sp. SK-4]